MGTARASGGCARAVSNPATGGIVPGQATLYIGALHLKLLHKKLNMTITARPPRAAAMGAEWCGQLAHVIVNPLPRAIDAAEPTSPRNHISPRDVGLRPVIHRKTR